MSLQQSQTSIVEHPNVRKEVEIHLQGAWLVLARIAWVAISLLAVGLFVASLPSYFAYLHIPATSSNASPQLTASDIQVLQRLGLSLNFYAWLNISVYIIILLVYDLVVWVAYWTISGFFPRSPLANSWLFFLILPGTVICLIALQVYRYRRVSTNMQRQQTKWVITGFAIAFGPLVISQTIESGFLTQIFPKSSLLITLLQWPFVLLLLMFPVSLSRTYPANE